MTNDREQRNLFGLVNSVRYECVSLLGESIFEKADVDLSDYEIYDHSGRLLEEGSSERALLQDPFRYVFIYDTDGKLLVREEYDWKGSLDGNTLYSGDEKGHKTESTCYSSGKLCRRRTLDGDSNVLEIELYSDQEEVSLRRVYEYQKVGNRVEELAYLFDGVGKKTGVLEHKTTRIFDEDGRETEQIIYRPDNSLWAKWVTTFNSGGHTIEEYQYNEGSSLENRRISIFDSNGNIKEEAYYEADGTLRVKRETDYEFDSTGNWIRSTVNRWTSWGSRRFGPYSITNRKIVYF